MHCDAALARRLTSGRVGRDDGTEQPERAIEHDDDGGAQEIPHKSEAVSFVVDYDAPGTIRAFFCVVFFIAFFFTSNAAFERMVG